MFPAAKNSSKA